MATSFAGGVIGCRDGTGTSAQFTKPYGVAMDTSKNVFVSDFACNSIRKVDANTGVYCL